MSGNPFDDDSTDRHLANPFESHSSSEDTALCSSQSASWSISHSSSPSPPPTPLHLPPAPLRASPALPTHVHTARGRSISGAVTSRDRHQRQQSLSSSFHASSSPSNTSPSATSPTQGVLKQVRSEGDVRKRSASNAVLNIFKRTKKKSQQQQQSDDTAISPREPKRKKTKGKEKETKESKEAKHTRKAEEKLMRAHQKTAANVKKYTQQGSGSSSSSSLLSSAIPSSLSPLPNATTNTGAAGGSLSTSDDMSTVASDPVRTQVRTWTEVSSPREARSSESILSPRAPPPHGIERLRHGATLPTPPTLRPRHDATTRAAGFAETTSKAVLEDTASMARRMSRNNVAASRQFEMLASRIENVARQNVAPTGRPRSSTIAAAHRLCPPPSDLASKAEVDASDDASESEGTSIDEKIIRETAVDLLSSVDSTLKKSEDRWSQPPSPRRSSSSSSSSRRIPLSDNTLRVGETHISIVPDRYSPTAAPTVHFRTSNKDPNTYPLAAASTFPSYSSLPTLPPLPQTPTDITQVLAPARALLHATLNSNGIDDDDNVGAESVTRRMTTTTTTDPDENESISEMRPSGTLHHRDIHVDTFAKTNSVVTILETMLESDQDEDEEGGGGGGGGEEGIYQGPTPPRPMASASFPLSPSPPPPPPTPRIHNPLNPQLGAIGRRLAHLSESTDTASSSSSSPMHAASSSSNVVAAAAAAAADATATRDSVVKSNPRDFSTEAATNTTADQEKRSHTPPPPPPPHADTHVIARLLEEVVLALDSDMIDQSRRLRMEHQIHADEMHAALDYHADQLQLSWRRHAQNQRSRDRTFASAISLLARETQREAEMTRQEVQKARQSEMTRAHTFAAALLGISDALERVSTEVAATRRETELFRVAYHDRARAEMDQNALHAKRIAIMQDQHDRMVSNALQREQELSKMLTETRNAFTELKHYHDTLLVLVNSTGMGQKLLQQLYSGSQSHKFNSKPLGWAEHIHKSSSS